LASGIPPLYALQKRGINVCLGTDGASSNDRLDMFREMFLASALQRGHLKSPEILKSDTVLKMATENGAKALGLKNVGVLKIGYKADIIMLDTIKSLTTDSIKNDIVFSYGAEDVKMTMVNGIVLYQNGKFNLKIGIKKLQNKCKQILNRLLK
jgi:5-methylthioadenosine/S-adenosylhomocysteine deaminase